MQTHAEREFKEKIKETVIEMLEGDREQLYPIFLEIMEDISLVKAMEEAENSPQVPENEILEILA